jgi:hypothetical protein
VLLSSRLIKPLLNPLACFLESMISFLELKSKEDTTVEGKLKIQMTRELKVSVMLETDDHDRYIVTSL